PPSGRPRSPGRPPGPRARARRPPRPPSPARSDSSSRDVAQPGSAPAWGAGGRGFKSRHPDHFRYTAHASSSPACVGLPHTMTQPRFRTPHVLLGALALLFSVTLTAQDAASRFAVAVVRADGAIVPFAAYHDGRWREMWTAVERKRYEIPATLDDIDR